MIGIIHGYGLTGSGSNLWTRSIIKTLCEKGRTVHLLCQERCPERHDFVTAAYAYDADVRREVLFEREVPYDGACILHRPKLDLLPIYVPPGAGRSDRARITELGDEAIEDYLTRNEAVLLHVVREHEITSMHVNHVVLMATAVQRVSEHTGLPFAVMPHGSAIEYVVRHDPRMQKLASDALRACRQIFLLNDREMRERLLSVFPEVPNAEAKMTVIRAGTDTRLFQIVDPASRWREIDTAFKQAIAGEERGRSREDTAALHEDLHEGLSKQEFLAILAASRDYEDECPDVDLESRLDALDWQNQDILTFMGKLIGHKGVPALIMALPALIEKNSELRLIMMGHGPLREVLEALLWALAEGKRRLVRSIIAWGGALEDEAPEPFEAAQGYLDALEREGNLDRFFEVAKRHLEPDHILFTGFLEQEALRHLLPCCDVGIFPSRVAEGSPLVVPEAAACGVFPMGTYFAGMAACLDVFASGLPEAVVPCLKLRPEPAHTVQDIADHVPPVLGLNGRYRKALRRVAVEEFDWRHIAAKLGRLLDTMDKGREWRAIRPF